MPTSYRRGEMDAVCVLRPQTFETNLTVGFEPHKAEPGLGGPGSGWVLRGEGPDGRAPRSFSRR